MYFPLYVYSAGEMESGQAGEVAYSHCLFFPPSSLQNRQSREEGITREYAGTQCEIYQAALVALFQQPAPVYCFLHVLPIVSLLIFL